jgi:8-oxo-dGTP pyrophosphatase MutT (NUDIX family)
VTTRRGLPEALAQRARAFRAGGLTPVDARPAATVILLREAVHDRRGIEVYVQRRHITMAFAGGMLAFPGGRCDPADFDPAEGDDAEAWADRLGSDPPTARGFVRAAVRETREETGVLLRPEDLVPWAHWITPRFEERRYDTWFFLAALPAGQEPADVSGEADHVTWVRPDDAIERAERGEWTMLPPTAVALSELRAYASVDATLDAARGRVIDVVVPGWVDDGRAVRLLLPGDDGYPGDDPRDPDDAEPTA